MANNTNRVVIAVHMFCLTHHFNANLLELLTDNTMWIEGLHGKYSFSSCFVLLNGLLCSSWLLFSALVGSPESCCMLADISRLKISGLAHKYVGLFPQRWKTQVKIKEDVVLDPSKVQKKRISYHVSSLLDKWPSNSTSPALSSCDVTLCVTRAESPFENSRSALQSII